MKAILLSILCLMSGFALAMGGGIQSGYGPNNVEACKNAVSQIPCRPKPGEYMCHCTCAIDEDSNKTQCGCSVKYECAEESISI